MSQKTNLTKAESPLDALANATLQRLEAHKMRLTGGDSGDVGGVDFLDSIKRSPAVFRDHLVRDTGFKTEEVGPNLDDWQRRDFMHTDDMWKFAARVSEYKPKHRRAYLERPRGHSKTTDIATMVLWALISAPVKIVGIAAAASEEQAKMILGAAEKIILDNPWLSQIVKIQESRVLNMQSGSECQAVAAKSNVRFGSTPDFVICDELTHWEGKQGKKLWTALFSGIHKVPTATMIVISNAGMGKGRSWQWGVRERFREDPAWYFSSLEGSIASWLSSEDLEEQERGLDDADFKRLILNQWVTSEKAGITSAELRTCMKDEKPTLGRNHGFDAIIGGVDIGIKHDRTSLVLLGVNARERKLSLLHHQTWKPTEFADNRVSLSEVESTIFQLNSTLRGINRLYFDDWQAIRSVQVINQRIPCSEVLFSSAAVRKAMANRFRDAFQNRWIELYPDEDLERDIQAIAIERNEVTHQLMLKAERDEHGHADSGFALAIAIMYGWEWMEALRFKLLSGETQFEVVGGW